MVVGEPAHRSQSSKEEGEGVDVDIVALEAEMAAALAEPDKDETPQLKAALRKAPCQLDNDSATLKIGSK